jgi:hypothetical protein
MAMLPYVPLHPADGGVLLFDTTAYGLPWLTLRAGIKGNLKTATAPPLLIGASGPFNNPVEPLILYSSTDANVAPYLQTQRKQCAVWQATKRDLHFIDFTTYDRTLSAIAFVAAQGAAMSGKIDRLGKFALTAMLNDEAAWADHSARKHAIFALIKATDADGVLLGSPDQQYIFMPSAIGALNAKLVSQRKDLSCGAGPEFFARLARDFQPRVPAGALTQKAVYRNPFLHADGSIDKQARDILDKIRRVLKDAPQQHPYHVSDEKKKKNVTFVVRD